MSHFVSHAAIEASAEQLFLQGMPKVEAYSHALSEAANDANIRELQYDAAHSYRDNFGIEGSDSFSHNRISRIGQKHDGEDSDKKTTKRLMAQAAMDSINSGIANALGEFLTSFSTKDLAESKGNCMKAAKDIIENNADQLTQDIPELKDPEVKAEVIDNLGTVINIQAVVIEEAIPTEELTNGDLSCSADQAISGDTASCTITDDTVVEVQQVTGVFMNQTENGTNILLVEGFHIKMDQALNPTVGQPTNDFSMQQPSFALKSPLEYGPQ